MAFPKITPTAALPKIVEILGMTDYGPCDPEPTAQCPHCGADGRYVYTFRCDDGTTRGAMAGCINLFPKHPLAEVMRRIREKDTKKQRLNGWDEKIRQAVDDWLSGKIDEHTAMSLVRSQQLERKSWIKRKYG